MMAIPGIPEVALFAWLTVVLFGLTMWPRSLESGVISLSTPPVATKRARSLAQTCLAEFVVIMVGTSMALRGLAQGLLLLAR